MAQTQTRVLTEAGANAKFQDKAGLDAAVAAAMDDPDSDLRASADARYVTYPRTRRVWVIGDSISDQGLAWDVDVYGAAVDVARAQGGLWQCATAWTTWASLASDGRWTLAGVLATAGDTAADALADHVPAVIATASPGDTVVVLIGTNGASTAMDDIPTIHANLRTAGLHTVAVTTPPRTAAPSTPQTLNAALVSWAQSVGVPLADAHAALVDATTGGYVTAYDSGDGIHPSEQGAKVLGETVAAVLNPLMTTAKHLIQFNAAATNYLKSKPLALSTPVAGTDYTNLAGVGTGSIGVGAFSEAKGGYGYIATRGDTDINARFENMTFVAGHKYRVGFILDLALSGGGTLEMRVVNSAGAGAGNAVVWGLGYHTSGTGRKLSQSLSARRMFAEFTVPTGFGDIYWLRFLLSGAGSVLKMSEITVADLTNLGAA